MFRARLWNALTHESASAGKSRSALSRLPHGLIGEDCSHHLISIFGAGVVAMVVRLLTYAGEAYSERGPGASRCVVVPPFFPTRPAR
jgi:hypothetical protein